ncbi:MAG: signal recognition particle-docking protein FtsY, partial [Candidatus Aminicenantes bacterium]
MIGNLKEKLAATRETFKEKFEELLRSDKDREEVLDKLAESMI